MIFQGCSRGHTVEYTRGEDKMGTGAEERVKKAKGRRDRKEETEEKTKTRETEKEKI